MKTSIYVNKTHEHKYSSKSNTRKQAFR